MQTVLIILHVLFALAIVGLVLLQRSEGGGLGLGGGGGGAGSMSGLMSARGTANFLTRATAIAATLFFVSSLALSMFFSTSGERRSIVEDIPAQTAPVESIEDQLPSVPVSE
ncbi:MAG: preprotein translocase subunit SecG [Rhodospirillales bacterium]|nr:preprotein translocase subunit SecG [Rhodospirillales bacterium]